MTDSVHALGGTIFAQLWHVGRVSHVSIQEDGKCPVGASDKIAKPAWTYAYQSDGTPGKIAASEPRALTTDEVKRVVRDFANAAANAIEAGFDGVEIHGANGYLLEQFMNPKVNDRTDEYTGATVDDRLKFPLEVVDAIIERVGRNRTAIRISPYARFRHASI
ncbi:oxidoreductase [Ochrobactrum sp. MYb379]|uniref:oxidoreductase n=1 Tax=Ochrobactrum sp. MYb379 TaxID=2745275 RepID=UPI00403F484A